ncbi:MAG TPA: hypothetical protein VLC08_11095 [Chitinolyticbacter sp.]|nr:hypothetical protein [Chitinolyticbacter sp.]
MDGPIRLWIRGSSCWPTTPKAPLAVMMVPGGVLPVLYIGSRKATRHIVDDPPQHE